jgi:protein kinase C substrate 80K-H
MSRTQEFSSKVMAKREAEIKRQADLQRELAEVSRHNKELQTEIKKLEITKKELQEAKLGVEKEEAELKQLRDEHKARCGSLEKELMDENEALRSDIEKLVATKKELIDAQFKAKMEESELAMKKKEYEIQIQLLEEEKVKLGNAMEKATAETNETNELSRTVLKELSEHKKSVEVDMSLVREMHDGRLKVLNEEREKLQAATTKAEQETAEAKANTSRILRELEEMTQNEEAQVAKLRAEYKARMEELEKEKEELAVAIDEAAEETTQTKEMTRTVLSELEEYKVKLEVDMQDEIKGLKKEIRE